MLLPKMHVETAANGHLTLSWPDAGPLFYRALLVRLRLLHGLRRSGRSVESPDAVLLPDLVGNGIRLLTGWDHWSGYSLLAVDQAVDDMLRRLSGRMTV
ncbi:hypothetical protein [Aquisphaera insulae]|uniref:hypothetical protein n=1 Tax=Aquisphaera insulae TaxID=2712864 RepID=UPI0013ED11D1|nr:hypothetical protein [Aquisphaera insulae]